MRAREGRDPALSGNVKAECKRDAKNSKDPRGSAILMMYGAKWDSRLLNNYLTSYSRRRNRGCTFHSRITRSLALPCREVPRSATRREPFERLSSASCSGADVEVDEEGAGLPLLGR